MSNVLSFALLGAAILAEVVATLSLKASAGMTRPGPMVLVVGGYGLAFWLLSLSLERFPIALVYSIWCGLGMVGAAVGGWWLFGQTLGGSALLGVVLITGGVAVLAQAMGGAPV